MNAGTAAIALGYREIKNRCQLIGSWHYIEVLLRNDKDLFHYMPEVMLENLIE